jgi:predicted TIM-barrel fold metal-dependent hydrolase
MGALGYPAFDGDNHYYEAEDAFQRHMDPRLRKRGVTWVDLRGRKRILIDGKLDRFIPNPTFDPVALPGSLDAFFRGRNPEGRSMAELFGRLEPIRAEYRDREARLAAMDRQGLEAILLFPTLAVGVEQPMRHDAELTHASLEAFNRWLDEDWGFAWRERLFAVPMITLMDPARAARELEWALSRGARMVHVRPAPVPGASGSFSPGDPVCDPFWARAAEAGITVAFHSGDAGYLRYAEDWGCSGEFESFRYDTLRTCLSASPIRDTMAALVCNGVFERHPNIRIATIESGSSWVPGLLSVLKKAYGQAPKAFAHDPVEQFLGHVWVSPYYEDDLERLRDTIGADHVLFGSDYPHAEGLAEPTDFVYDLKGFSKDEIQLAMRENGFGLARRRPA